MLTKQEAADLLGLMPDASEAEVRSKYNEMYNDYQLRLTNAPTPNLKKLYQKNLQELNDAFSVFLGGASPGNTDLPSSEPVFTAEEKQPVVSQAQQAQRNQTARNTGPAKNAQVKTYKKPFSFLVTFCILLLALAAWLGVEFFQGMANQEELLTGRKKLEEFKEFENGKFKIRNDGDAPLTVEWLIISYKDENGKLVKYEDVVAEDIRPDANMEFRKLSGASILWDGSVISYACGLKYHNNSFIQAGLWSADSKDGYLMLDLSSR